MTLKNTPIEELEILSYTDITYLLLKENAKSVNTAILFKDICKLLDMSDDEFADKVGDYYTSLVIDKRFKLLENNEWDLSEKHKVEADIDDSDEEDFDEEEIEDEEPLEDKYEDDDTDDIEVDEDDFDEDDDDYHDDTEEFKGLNIVSEDELEEE